MSELRNRGGQAPRTRPALQSAWRCLAAPGQGRGAHRLLGMLPFSARVGLLAVVLLLLGGASVRPSAAHRALLIGNSGLDRASATWISDADIAWAVFGQLPSGRTQHLAFMRPASGMFRARALVPIQQANLRLNPWLAVVGPGLPRPEGLEGLLGPDEGAILVGGPADREVEMSDLIAPFPYLVGASLELALPAEGPYYLLILDPSGQSGPYLIDIGYLQD